MSHSSIRIWFCIAVAVVAASVADPIVEFASNAGWFGFGNYTDHSNLDVVPSLLVGLLFVGTQLIRRLCQLLSPDRRDPARTWLRASSDALRSPHVGRLLPWAFAIQLLVLYVMETAEQIVVRGHGLGGTIWLGGPVVVSVAIHALVLLGTSFTFAKTLQAFARNALRIAAFIRLALLLPHKPTKLVWRFRDSQLFRWPTPLRCRIGERAPPLLNA